MLKLSKKDIQARLSTATHAPTRDGRIVLNRFRRPIESSQQGLFGEQMPVLPNNRVTQQRTADVTQTDTGGEWEWLAGAGSGWVSLYDYDDVYYGRGANCL